MEASNPKYAFNKHTCSFKKGNNEINSCILNHLKQV